MTNITKSVNSFDNFVLKFKMINILLIKMGGKQKCKFSRYGMFTKHISVFSKTINDALLCPTLIDRRHIVFVPFVSMFVSDALSEKFS